MGSRFLNTPGENGREPGYNNPLPGQVPSLRELQHRSRSKRLIARLTFWRR
jgi:hypothetical protein